MEGELTWHVGKDEAPLDEPPYRAYFYWKRDGKIMRSADYSAEELEAEVTRLKHAGEDTSSFEEALRRLRGLG